MQPAQFSCATANPYITHEGRSLLALPLPPISATTYAYDGMACVTEMRCSNGWADRRPK